MRSVQTKALTFAVGTWRTHAKRWLGSVRNVLSEMCGASQTPDYVTVPSLAQMRFSRT